MQFYEFYCPICQVHMVAPVTKENHIKGCDGEFKGTLLPQVYTNEN